jgi:hypothetical protein
MGAPQLVLLACLDEDNQVVHCAGMMTAPELQRALQGDQAALNPSADLDELALSGFRGGAERLLTLVQLLNPDAISRDGLTVARRSSVVSPFDWLSEQLDQAIQGLCGSLVPATAGRFRSAVESNSNALGDALHSPWPGGRAVVQLQRSTNQRARVAVRKAVAHSMGLENDITRASTPQRL